uniref:Major facilitator superfamily (MFS) profile domain-containing protein n=1 Tax=Oryctolagus cuniculus TaxID=9986 RepID=G1SJ31_RABIT
MAFTDLLDALGGVGRFQLVYTALLLLPCGLLACHNFLQNFTAAMPPHHCRGPANLTNTSGVWLRATVPMDRLGALDSCRRFTEPQWVLLLPNASSGHGAATEGCVDGWEYDRSVFPSTIVTEWDLVCEARTLRDLAQSIYMAGVLLGAAVFGSLADRLGRKAPLVWSYLQLAVSGAATAYVSSFSAYCVFRFLMGMTFSGIILNSLSLGKARGHFAIFGSERTWLKVCLGLGTGMSSTRPWVLLPPSLGPRWLPESSRWLLLHGKSQQALQNLRKVAALNGREEESKRLTTEAVSAYVQSEFASVRTSSSVLDLFRTPAIRKVTCCLVGVWFSNSVAYYGLAMDLHKFGLSLYLVQALFGIIDIPAMLLATITMIYVGRRATVASFLIMAGLTVIANMFVPEAMQTVRTAQAALGKGCLASSFICVYLFTGELYPTEIRQMGMGFASVSARLGGLAAPLLTTLGEVSAFLPPVSFGATSILAGVAVLCFLTETRNAPLVETIAAMERRCGAPGADTEKAEPGLGPSPAGASAEEDGSPLARRGRGFYLGFDLGFLNPSLFVCCLFTIP